MVSIAPVAGSQTLHHPTVSFTKNPGRAQRKPLFSNCPRRGEYYAEKAQSTPEAPKYGRVKPDRSCVLRKELPTNRNAFGAAQFEVRDDAIDKRMNGGLITKESKKCGHRTVEDALRQQLIPSKADVRCKSVPKTMNVLPSLKCGKTDNVTDGTISDILNGSHEPRLTKKQNILTKLVSVEVPDDVADSVAPAAAEPDSFSPASTASSESPAIDYMNYRYEKMVESDGKPLSRAKIERVKTDARSGEPCNLFSVASPLAPWKGVPFGGLSAMVQPPDKQAELEGMGNVLCRVYGGKMAHIVCSFNSVSLPLEYVTERDDLAVAPTLWLRGGRVYDFTGDLGTYDEFVQSKNPWQTNRSNRRTAGFQPFPFLPDPIGERTEDGISTRHLEELKKWGACARKS